MNVYISRFNDEFNLLEDPNDQLTTMGWSHGQYGHVVYVNIEGLGGKSSNHGDHLL